MCQVDLYQKLCQPHLCQNSSGGMTASFEALLGERQVGDLFFHCLYHFLHVNGRSVGPWTWTPIFKFLNQFEHEGRSTQKYDAAPVLSSIKKLTGISYMYAKHSRHIAVVMLSDVFVHSILDR